MTGTDRIDRLPELLSELAAPRTPAYLDDVLARTAGQRQRPARTLLERILPMSETTLPSVRTSPPAWRTFAIALLLTALAVALAAGAFIASRPRSVPAPYGPAANGLITYSSSGDIYTADPVTGATKAIVTGPELDRNPVFSRDGARIVFRRDTGRQTASCQTTVCNGLDLVVVDADGTGAHVVTTDPISVLDPVEWAPDGASLIVLTAESQLVRLDASKAAPPVVIAEQINAGGTGPIMTTASLRPPDGTQILFRPPDGRALSIVNVDGTGRRTLIQKDAAAAPDGDFEPFRWSPDGTKIAFRQNMPGPYVEARIFIMNADGSGVRQLSNEPGVWVESDFVWSPDGSHVAFNRWQRNAMGGYDIQPIGVAAADGGPVVSVGPVPVPEGAVFDWSPDGSTILSLPAQIYDGIPHAAGARPTVIDATTGDWHDLAVDVESAATWQRLAP